MVCLKCRCGVWLHLHRRNRVKTRLQIQPTVLMIGLTGLTPVGEWGGMGFMC